MPSLNDQDRQREAVRKALELRFEGDPGAEQIAKATLVLWAEVASKLAPIIGLRGVAALYGRSLHLTSVPCPWLALPPGQENPYPQPDHLGTRLAEQGVDKATAASMTFFLTLADLLAGLIGPSLTDRLLAPVWTAQVGSTAQELPHEP